MPFQINNITINHTTKCTYLGATVSNENISITNYKAHMSSSYRFSQCDAPYAIKHRVWSSALNAAILYSSET